MDITAILGGIKGKVLDAVNFDLLKATYELQNENIEQLKTNSAALQMSNTLLMERVATLESAAEQLRAENAQLRSRVPNDNDIVGYSPSPLAEKIIRVFRFSGESMLRGNYLCGLVGASSLQVEVAFNEIIANGVGVIGGYGNNGPMYCLTDAGKKFAVQYPRG